MLQAASAEVKEKPATSTRETERNFRALQAFMIAIAHNQILTNGISFRANLAAKAEKITAKAAGNSS